MLISTDSFNIIFYFLLCKFLDQERENSIETCEMSCMKRDDSPGSMHDAGCLGLVHWDDPEGWYGEGGGFSMGNTCIIFFN